MAHEIAKLILEHADSIADRKTAIEKAMEIGMPFAEIEEYLDWLDAKNVNKEPAPVSKPENQTEDPNTVTNGH